MDVIVISWSFEVLLHHTFSNTKGTQAFERTSIKFVENLAFNYESEQFSCIVVQQKLTK